MKFFLNRNVQIAAGATFILMLIGGLTWHQSLINKNNQQHEAALAQFQTNFNRLLPIYADFNKKIADYKNQGVDVTSALKQRDTVRQLILSGAFNPAESLMQATLAQLQTTLLVKQAADKQAADAEAACLAALATPSPKPTAKPTPKPTTKPAPVPAQLSNSSTTTWSRYEQKTVNTSRGTFTVNIITLDMHAGGARLITDTASDSDCSDNCPVLSLANYVSRNGGFAGINGTYFCPADYASCAGKINTFYWKIYASRLAKFINLNNGLGERDPVLVYGTDKQPHYFDHWNDFVSSGMQVTAGINSWPALVSGGHNVLDTSQLDSKQQTVKSNRGSLGISGTTVYAVVARSATVPDLAEIMVSLGAASAMNIDGGGSSAIYYGGGYKVGPGRNLPNAVIFAE